MMAEDMTPEAMDAAIIASAQKVEHYEIASYGGLVQLTIGLHTRTPNSRTLAAVEHTAVDRGPVGGTGHQSVEHVELANQMPLPNPADRRVAGHLTDILSAKSHKPDARATARRGRRSLAAGVAAADDQDIKHAKALSRFCPREKIVSDEMFHVKHPAICQGRNDRRERPAHLRHLPDRSVDRTPTARIGALPPGGRNPWLRMLC